MLEAIAFSSTTDCWSSCQRYAYIGVTVHFIDNSFSLRNYTVAIRYLQESHSAENIKSALCSIYDEFAITDKILMINGDNAATISAAIDLFKNNNKKTDVFRLRCVAHIFHLVINKVFNLKSNETENTTQISLPSQSIRSNGSSSIMISKSKNSKSILQENKSQTASQNETFNASKSNALNEAESYIFEDSESIVTNSDISLNNDEQLALSSLQFLIKKCRKICGTFHHSTQLSDLLRQIQTDSKVF